MPTWNGSWPGVRKTLSGQPPWPVAAWQARWYTSSMSGLSSLSTFMLTKLAFMKPAISAFSKESCSMTWHQWQELYPTLKNMGMSCLSARSSASGPHGYQSTGLPACCSRYVLVSRASLFTPARAARPYL